VVRRQRGTRLNGWGRRGAGRARGRRKRRGVAEYTYLWRENLEPFESPKLFLVCMI
jgi:hypothetical protein